MTWQRAVRHDPDRTDERKKPWRPTGSDWVWSRIRRHRPVVESLEGRTLLTTISEFSVAPGNSPAGITAGLDGNLWFTDRETDSIGQFNPKTHAIAEFPVPSGRPRAITAGSDGNLWFTDGIGQIGMINPATHAIAEFPTPTIKKDTTGITAGPDGNVWFLEQVITLPWAISFQAKLA